MFKLKKLPDYTLVSPLGHKIFSWNAIWWFFITHFTPSSSAAPQTAGEAVWGFSRISSFPRGECWASLDVWALRRKARERSDVRLAMVATNGLVDGSLIWWWRIGGMKEEGWRKRVLTRVIGVFFQTMNTALNKWSENGGEIQGNYWLLWKGSYTIFV